MKIHSKITVVALALNLLIPTATLAEDGQRSTDSTRSPEVHSSPTTSPSSSTKVEAKGDVQKFCVNLTSIQTKLGDETSSKSSTLKKDFDDRSTKILSKRIELTAKLATNRTKADAERANKFAELEAKAKSDTQKVAVKAYETSVLAAVAKHRANIDAADKVFLDGVTSSITERQATMLALNKAYQVTVAFAVASAKASCATGVSAKTVRDNLMTTIKTAQAKFTEARKAAEKVHPDLNPLKTAHRAAIKKADQDFRASLKAALTTLKAALAPTKSESDGTNIKPTDSPASSPSPSV